MLQKLKNKKGFTLMEMLIVVAIIAVLVAIAIPTFSGALTKSKEAADVANIRAYYAEQQIKAIENSTSAAPTVGAGETIVTVLEAAGYNINEDAKVSYDAGTKTITYASTKLTGGNGADTKTYTWTFGDATA